jgi:hypothetical protein
MPSIVDQDQPTIRPPAQLTQLPLTQERSIPLSPPHSKNGRELEPPNRSDDVWNAMPSYSIMKGLHGKHGSKPRKPLERGGKRLRERRYARELE